MTRVPPSTGSVVPNDPMPLEAVFGRAWTLLRANWIIALPPVILAVFCASFAAPFVVTAWSSGVGHAGHVAGPREPVPWWAMASFAVAYTLLLVGAFSSTVIMFAMADVAWFRGRATFDDGFSALRSRSWALTAAGFGLCGVSLVALILAIPTLGLSMLAFVVFTIYVMPAAIGGKRGGFAAIAESFRLVRGSFVRSAIGIALLLAVYYAITFAGYFAVFPMMAWFMKVVSDLSDSAHVQALPPPPVPLLVACGAIYAVVMLVSLAYYGYYALVLVGMYRSLVGPGKRR